jgi:hypothetical protein
MSQRTLIKNELKKMNFTLKCTVLRNYCQFQLSALIFPVAGSRICIPTQDPNPDTGAELDADPCGFGSATLPVVYNFCCI